MSLKFLKSVNICYCVKLPGKINPISDRNMWFTVTSILFIDKQHQSLINCLAWGISRGVANMSII